MCNNNYIVTWKKVKASAGRDDDNCIWTVLKSKQRLYTTYTFVESFEEFPTARSTKNEILLLWVIVIHGAVR